MATRKEDLIAAIQRAQEVYNEAHEAVLKDVSLENISKRNIACTNLQTAKSRLKYYDSSIELALNTQPIIK